MTDAEAISRLEELRDWGAQDGLCEDLEVYEAAIRFYEERDEARALARAAIGWMREENPDWMEEWLEANRDKYPWLKEDTKG